MRLLISLRQLNWEENKVSLLNYSPPKMILTKEYSKKSSHVLFARKQLNARRDDTFNSIMQRHSSHVPTTVLEVMFDVIKEALWTTPVL